ncbi:MAG TPA: hypothetical protein VGB63_16830 [Pedobacter sp.]|jgi:hypothetical protein
MNHNLYTDFKSGIKKDVSGFALNIVGAAGLFFFLWFLLMVLWYAIAKNSPAGSGGERLIAIIFLIIIIPCLFVKRLSNIILQVWGLMLILIVGAIVLIPVGYVIYVSVIGAFGFND